MTSESSSSESSKRRRLSQECYGSYSTSQLSDLFLAALFEDASDETNLALAVNKIEEKHSSELSLEVSNNIPISSLKRKREISSSPSYIDLTSDASQPSQELSKKTSQFSISQQRSTTTTTTVKYITENDIMDENYRAILDNVSAEQQNCTDNEVDMTDAIDESCQAILDSIPTGRRSSTFSEQEIEMASDINVLPVSESLVLNAEAEKELQPNSENEARTNVEEIQNLEEEGASNLEGAEPDIVEGLEENESIKKAQEKEDIDESMEEEYREQSDSDSDELDELEDSDEDKEIDVDAGREVDTPEQDDLSAESTKIVSEIEKHAPVEVAQSAAKEQLDTTSPEQEAISVNSESVDIESDNIVDNNDFDHLNSLDMEALESVIVDHTTVKAKTIDEGTSSKKNEADRDSQSVVDHEPTDEQDSDDGNDVFYDVEYVDIDENGNLTGSQNTEKNPKEDSSLDLFKESAINESQIVKAYHELETNPIEVDVQITQVKGTVQNPDNESPVGIQDTVACDVEGDREDGEEVFSNPQGIPESIPNSDNEEGQAVEDELMEDIVIAKENIVTHDSHDARDNLENENTLDLVIAEDNIMEDVQSAEEIGEEVATNTNIEISDSSLEIIVDAPEVIEDENTIDDNEDDEIIEIMDEIDENHVDLTEEVIESLDVDMEDDLPIIEEEEELVIDSDDEEISLSIPESLPMLHENTQIIPEHWREEEMKLKNTFEPPRFTDFNKRAVEVKDVINNEKSLKMWWYDAVEENKKTVFLFGKTFHPALDKYVSCCMIVENLQREIYILPRPFKMDENGELTDEEVTFEDVKNEIAEKLANKEIHQYTMEIWTKKYAFELPNIPRETQYIKLCYSYKDYNFPQGVTGKTFSHMFGTSVSALEHLIIEKDMMGPCWLKFDNVTKTLNAKSWCAVEGLVTNPDNCSVIKENLESPPPITIMSLSLHTFMNYDSQFNEIGAIGGFVCQDADIENMDASSSKHVHRFSITTTEPRASNHIDDERPLLKIYRQESEVGLLYAFLAQLQIIDPDVIIGHNFIGVDLDILLHRLKRHNVVNWSRIGRRRRDKFPKLQAGAGGFGKSSFAEQASMRGRLLCDTYLASQDLLQSKSYHLNQLALSQLNIIREEFDKRDPKLYKQNGAKELEVARHCSFDAYLAFALAVKLQILPLTLRLTNLSGNLWSRSMNGGRSDRNEYLLLHSFYNRNYICPDRPIPKKKNSSSFSAENELELEASSNTGHDPSSSSYAGGLVLEAKVGFYDKYVILLDFNSLYPSIMREYNICFTTVQRKLENIIDTREVPPTPDDDCPEGILPGVVRVYVERRQRIKKLMKDSNLSKSHRTRSDIEQRALKLTANSVYGCLGSTISRFYAKPLAMLITHKGREILRSTVDSAERLGFNVIYGDTDSIMIHTGETKMSRVQKIGEKMKEHVNKKYKMLEIDVDGYFRHTLLLKKKKYAALLVKSLPSGGLEEFVEVKGLDLVRRDWCELSHMISEHILKLILSDSSREAVVNSIYDYLRHTTKQIYSNKFPLSDFIIRKQLTKNLEEYNNKLPHPHVHVAKEMRRQGASIKSGDIVPYVICTRSNEAGKSFNEPCIPESCSLGGNGGKKIDIEWYLSKQILPPVHRLCGPIEGITLDSLIQCVGLVKEKMIKKAKMVNTQSSQEDKEVDPDLSIYMEDSRYFDPEALYLNCTNCSSENKYTGPLKSIGDKVIQGLQCEDCGNTFNAASVRVKIQCNVAHYIQKYHSSGFICDQADCDFASSFIPLHTTNCPVCAGSLVREYSAKMLYTQLFEMRKLFDTSLIKWNSYDATVKDELEPLVKSNEFYDTVKELIDTYLHMSKYNFIDMSTILQP